MFKYKFSLILDVWNIVAKLTQILTDLLKSWVTYYVIIALNLIAGDKFYSNKIKTNSIKVFNLYNHIKVSWRLLFSNIFFSFTYTN